MFGISHLPFSTSETVFLNGDKDNIILYINTSDSLSLSQKTVVTITLNIEQDQEIELV